MSLLAPATPHEVYGQELAELLDTVLAGEVVTDRDMAERLVRSIGALASASATPTRYTRPMRGLLAASLVVSMAAETVHLHGTRGVEFLSTTAREGAQ